MSADVFSAHASIRELLARDQQQKEKTTEGGGGGGRGVGAGGGGVGGWRANRSRF